jgi:hypothetical protein
MAEDRSKMSANGRHGDEEPGGSPLVDKSVAASLFKQTGRPDKSLVTLGPTTDRCENIDRGICSVEGKFTRYTFVQHLYIRAFVNIFWFYISLPGIWQFGTIGT